MVARVRLNDPESTGGNRRTSPSPFIEGVPREGRRLRCRSRMPAAGGAAWQARRECEPCCSVLTVLLRPSIATGSRHFPARNDQKLADADATCRSVVYRYGTTCWLHTSRSIMDHYDTLMQLVQLSRSSSRLAQPAKTASSPAPGSCSGRPLSEAVGIGRSQSLPCVCISRASSAS